MTLSGKILPAHPKPFEDELLTSWLVRLAKNNGMKLETFAKQSLKTKTQLWNRDFDRGPIDSVVKILSEKTGRSVEDIMYLSLKNYQSKLYSYYCPSGIINWILPLRVHHRKRIGFGQQFCSQCLMEDEVPYFRKCWRISLNTFCHKHKIMLREKCPNCKHPIMFYRQEIGKPNVYETNEMCFCTVCEFDLRNSIQKPIAILDRESFELLSNLIKSLESFSTNNKLSLDLEQLNVLHQFCKLTTSKATGPKIKEYFQDKFKKYLVDYNPNMNFYELHSLNYRHQILQIAIWILFDWENRVNILWRNKIVRYNYFKKDFVECPDWYRDVIDKFNRRY